MSAIKTHPIWTYQEKPVNSLEDFPKGTYGFIYEVLHKVSGMKYIGKKVLFFERNKVLGKRALEELKQERKDKGLRGRTPLKKKVISESDWKTYYGSQNEIKELVTNGQPEDFTRTILQLVPKKKLLTYYENKWLFSKEVIEPGSKYLNNSVEGRYFRKDFEV